MFGMITPIPYLTKQKYETGGSLYYKPLLRRPVELPNAIDGDTLTTTGRRGNRRRQRGMIYTEPGAPIPATPIAVGDVTATPVATVSTTTAAAPVDSGFTLAGLPVLPIAIAGLALILLMKK